MSPVLCYLSPRSLQLQNTPWSRVGPTPHDSPRPWGCGAAEAPLQEDGYVNVNVYVYGYGLGADAPRLTDTAGFALTACGNDRLQADPRFTLHG